MKILFTCGGTAGHINPALGVAGRIREKLPDTDILFVGAEGHMETELVPHEGYPIRTLKIAGFRRGFSFRAAAANIRTVFLVVRAVRESRKILRSFRPDVVVGTGGYVCYPVLKAAGKLHIPSAVHESNAVPGLTTRLLEGKVDRILVGFEESRSAYKDPGKVEVTGTPVRAGFRHTEREKARRELGFRPDERIVLAVFGSLGAGRMNQLMEDVIRRMGNDAPFRLIYATGKRYYDEVQDMLSRAHLHSPMIDVREYIYDMPKVMSAADLIICRCGASTISEITYMGIPAVLIPSPNVVNDHQTKNGSVLANAGAAVMFAEEALDGERLFDEITRLLHDPQQRADMHQASLRLGVPEAAERIASLVEELAENHQVWS